MTGPRTRLTQEEIAGIRAARAKGASLDELAKQFGRSRSHIANLVRHHAELTRTAQAADALAPVGALDVARAEFAASRAPLVVETLEERLERALPGALVSCSQVFGAAPWSVTRNGRELVVGYSHRDVVDKAIALYGVQR